MEFYDIHLLDLTVHWLYRNVKAQQDGNATKKSSKKNVKRDIGEENLQDYIDPETPVGEKKRLSRQMAKQYNPSAVEKS